jgi:hypothetical protein
VMNGGWNEDSLHTYNVNLVTEINASKYP